MSRRYWRFRWWLSYQIERALLARSWSEWRSDKAPK